MSLIVWGTDLIGSEIDQYVIQEYCCIKDKNASFREKRQTEAMYNNLHIETFLDWLSPFRAL